MNPTGSHWTYEAVQTLIALVREGAPASVIALLASQVHGHPQARAERRQPEVWI